MIFGSVNSLAIEISVKEVVDDWLLGSFLLWMNGERIGDPEDQTVDIRGCVHWLRDFVENPRDRYEPDLYEMNIHQVLILLNGSVIPGTQERQFVTDKYQNTFSRFHISHIGMSSFENVTILLVESRDGEQRFIWQCDNVEPCEAKFGVGEFDYIVKMTLLEFEKSLEKRGADL